MLKQFYLSNPNHDQKLADRKERFESLNAFVSKRNGWITSVPGAREITFEALPDSALPADLDELGYQVREEGEGQRILAGSVIESFTRRADGELEPLTAGSTKPIAETRTHAGIARVLKYSFDLP